MQSLTEYSWRSYSQTSGVQRSSEEWGTGRNWTLLDQIHGLHLALHVQRNQKIEPEKIEPDQYKFVIS